MSVSSDEGSGMKEQRSVRRLIAFLVVMLAAGYATVRFMPAQARSSRSGSRIRDVGSEAKFDSALRRHDYVVVMLYYQDREMRKLGQKTEEIDRLEQMFSSVSREPLYENAAVAFFSVNLVSRDTTDLLDTYNISAEKELPAFLLFRLGDALSGMGGKAIRISGYLKRDQLISFINSNFKIENLKDESDRIEAMEEEEREHRRENRMYWYGGYRPWGYGYGWPYYGHHFGHHGYYGHGGFGFGW